MKIYHGPSMLEPSRNIMVWVTLRSNNRKTGDMVQVYLFDADTPPAAAVKTGDDASVCGDCKLRPLLAKGTGRKACYVQKGWLRGTYEAAKRAGVTPLDEAAERIAETGKPVRLGAYGDPTAAPFGLMRRIAQSGKGHTGYTHQWRNPRVSDAEWHTLVMASCDSIKETEAAIARGYRTFSVRQPNESGLAFASFGATVDEFYRALVTCPASDEAGKRTTCAKCLLCHGRKARGPWKSVTILAH